jgi:hypothetical protein
MSSYDVVLRLEAYAAGHPIPAGSTLPFRRVADSHRFIAAFVRNGGEALPWAIAWGCVGSAPTVDGIPEPRDLDAVAGLCARFGKALDDHLGHPGVHTTGRHDAQVWLPGGAHVDMLHILALRYTRARKGEVDRVAALNRLGRTCGYLFRESSRPGQQCLFDATACLNQQFAFPAQDSRQQHLGFLLGWLTAAGSVTARRAAAGAAEAQSVGATMDPALENERLAPLLEGWQEATGKAREREAARIHTILCDEARRRWKLTEDAIRVFDQDSRPDNPELEPLVELSHNRYEHDYRSAEQRVLDTDPETPVFVVDPETDHFPAAAASAYHALEHASEIHGDVLAHGDAGALRRLVSSGEAIEGRIVEVRDESVGRKMVAVWVVEAGGAHPLRFRAGSQVCPVGLRKRVGEIRDVVVDGGVRRFEIEIIGGKTRRALPQAPEANDASRLTGTEVYLVGVAQPFFTQKRMFAAWDGDGPGGWLTHATPQPRPMPRRPRAENLAALVERLGGR